jgi:hypothetical protein
VVNRKAKSDRRGVLMHTVGVTYFFTTNFVYLGSAKFTLTTVKYYILIWCVCVGEIIVYILNLVLKSYFLFCLQFGFSRIMNHVKVPVLLTRCGTVSS